MKDLESNKIFASILIFGIAVLVVSNLVDIFYHPEQTAEYGYIVDAQSKSAEAAAPAAFDIAKIDIGALLSGSDIESGKKISKKCTACHSFEKGGPQKVGPNLWGIVGNKKAHLGDQYAYSKGLKEMGGVWDYQSLIQFLHKPSKYIKGTKMSFAGLAKQDQLGDILLYLRGLSENPMPLPAPLSAKNEQEVAVDPKLDSQGDKN